MRLAALLAAVIVIASNANASVVLQDFNANPSNLTNGAALPPTYFPGMTISNALLVYQGPNNPAIAFNYPNGGPSGDFVSNSTNFNGDFLGAAGNNNGSAVITITFDSPVSNVSIWLADIDNSESYVLSTLDPSQNQIGSVTVSAGMSGTGDGVATNISIPGSNVKELVVTPSGTVSQIGYGLDDLQYNNAPEPTSGALVTLLSGALALRRVRRS